MTNIINLHLQSIKVTNATIINNHDVEGEKLKLTFSRKVSPIENNLCTGTCICDLRLTSEEDFEPQDCSFLIRISVNGIFFCNERPEQILEEDLRTSAVMQMLPHVRAFMSTIMTTLGMPPYLIPDSLIPELSN